MGRPPLPKDQKRQQVNIRLNPEDRAHLEEMASRHGGALATTAEGALSEAIESDRQAGEGGPTPARREAIARLVRGTNDKRPRDDETLILLADIAEQIDVIQDLTRKRWHKDRRTWAAVAQMLAKGPIGWHETDNPVDDEDFEHASLSRYAVGQLKQIAVAKIARLGVVVSPSVTGYSRNNALAYFSRGGELHHVASNRDSESAIIDALPDPAARADAKEAFEKLRDLDRQEHELSAKISEMIMPFLDEEIAGRDLYADHRREIAAAAKEAGEPYRFEDLQ